MTTAAKEGRLTRDEISYKTSTGYRAAALAGGFPSASPVVT